jgi:hypothetical protein
MLKAACVIAFVAAVAIALPAGAAEQAPRLEDLGPHPAQAAGFSLLAATANVVYFPVRLAVTAVTGVVGGFTGWLTGGDGASTQAVWNSTEGQAFITPRVVEGRESLRFGPWPSR